MKHKYFKNSLFLLGLILFTNLSFSQGSEDFTNSNATSSYGDNSFTGNDGFTWSFVESRDENGDANGAGISGDALMLRRSTEPSSLIALTIPGGIGNFSITLYKGFTGSGNRQVELFINDVSKGTSLAFDDTDDKDKYVFTVNNINVTGTFKLEIRNITSKQVIIDDLVWTGYTTPVVWSGATDNDWDTDSNWVGGSKPGSSADVSIPNGLTNYPTAATAVTVNSVTINSGASLIAQNAFTGNVIYNRNLGTNNWYLISSPVNGETINDLISGHTFDSGTGTNIGVAPYDNSQATASDRWTYQELTSTGSMNNGQGFSVKLDSSGDITFIGSMNVADVDRAISVGAGDAFNLIGNPFTSFLNSGTGGFLPDNTGLLTSQTLWVWNESTSSYDTKMTGDEFKIAPGQGFFVEANGSGNVTFSEADQSHETSDTFQRNSRTEVHLFMNDDTTNRYAKLYYIDGKTTGFDNGYDGELFRGVANPFAIYTHLLSDSQGKNYQVQSLPSSDYENMIVPVGVNAVAGKELTFSANAMNLPSGINVYLEDKLTNTFTRLDETNSEYKVTLNNDLNGIGRFYLHTNSQVLNTPNFDLSSVSIYKTSKTNVRVTGLQSGNTTMNLYNILGKKVHSNSFIAKSVNDINLPVLNTGVYIVQLTTEQGKINKKIIIE